MRRVAAIVGVGAIVLIAVAVGLTVRRRHAPFELQTTRMDVDVDGAPNAYGPAGLPALDSEIDSHFLERADQPVVGYLLDDKQRPVLQGANDPFPGYYVSQTAFVDDANPNDRDPRRYVDATRINYVVRGGDEESRGVQVGDFVAVYSKRTRRAVYGIVGDTGNPTGEEGSLHLFQALGYPFQNGTDDSVQGPEVVIRFYPGSNPKRKFFFEQEKLDEAALRAGIAAEFRDR